MPREITAFSNPLIKRVRLLRDKKHRRDEGLFLAEGLRILTEAREAGRLPEYLFYAGDSGTHPLVEALVARSAEMLVPMTVVRISVIFDDPRRPHGEVPIRQCG